MSETQVYSSDVGFTPAVKAVQARKGSRETYAHVEERGGWRTEIDENLAAFLAEANSFYLATASADGQPYIQHRGGPKGFIRILDKNTLAFADYKGNQKFIREPQGLYFRDGLCPSSQGEAVGRSANRRKRSCTFTIADAWGLSGAPGAGDPVYDLRLGHQLPAAYSAEIRCRRRGRGARLARYAYCGA
jgi:predicted pyridoxine 5'-phosphate oxidase superfamily flavin-nucleotide-binding protein